MRHGTYGLDKGASPRSSIEILEARIAPATIFVTSLGDSGNGSLRAAIEQANDADGADVIKFKVRGEIDLESSLPTITDSVFIKGKGSANTTIDGRDAFRILEIESASPLNVTIAGLTLENGRATGSGGALWIDNVGGKVLIDKCVIQENVAVGLPGQDAAGGGIANENALLTISKSIISGNQSLGGAGADGPDGANGTASTPGVAGTNGIAGGAGNGGGIYNAYYGSLTLLKSTISGNIAQGGTGGNGGNGGGAGGAGNNTPGRGGTGGAGGNAYGGGVDNRGSLWIQQTVISGNTALGSFGGNGGNSGTGGFGGTYGGDGGDGGNGGGGGVANDGLLIMSRSRISGNDAFGEVGGSGGSGERGYNGYNGYAGYSEGGGIQSYYGSVLIDKSTISGNDSGQGGGIWIAGENSLIQNSLILNNIAHDGGGMFVDGFGTRLVNTVVADNVASDTGGGISANGNLEVTRSRITGNTVDALNGGLDTAGGGIYVRGSVSITESVISFNTVTGDGGGIHVGGEGEAELFRSVVTSNSATGSGGGISNSDNGYLGVFDSAVVENTAGRDGGGIAIEGGGFVIVEKSTVSSNTADRDGGGLAITGTPRLLVQESTLSGNTALRNGGGLSNTGSTQEALTEIERSTISRNAAEEGGGIFHTGGYLDILASTIAFNTATETRGGGLSVHAAMQVVASTIARNSAENRGGGMWVDDALDPFEVVVLSTIIADNRAPIGPDVQGSIDAFYSLVEDGSGNAISGDNNLTEIDPLLGPLKNNGGPTLTMAPKARSPVIDAGSAYGELYDQAGNVRFLGWGVDIGAVEVR